MFDVFVPLWHLLLTQENLLTQFKESVYGYIGDSPLQLMTEYHIIDNWFAGEKIYMSKIIILEF